MTEKIFKNLSTKQRTGLKHYLNEHEVTEPLEVIAYIASNIISPHHGPTMGATWSRMEQEAKNKFGKDINIYGAIMDSYKNVPEVMVKDRSLMNGFGGNEPFDMIVYKKNN